MRKAKNRKERMEFISKKLGMDFALLLYNRTDREVKIMFDQLFPIYKDKKDFVIDIEPPICLKCGSEAYATWHCTSSCEENYNGPILDENDLRECNG